MVGNIMVMTGATMGITIYMYIYIYVISPSFVANLTHTWNISDICLARLYEIFIEIKI